MTHVVLHPRRPAPLPSPAPGCPAPPLPSAFSSRVPSSSFSKPPTPASTPSSRLASLPSSRLSSASPHPSPSSSAPTPASRTVYSDCSRTSMAQRDGAEAVVTERYREMGIGATLSRPWDYPTACGEIAAPLCLGYVDLTKAAQALVAGDVLLTFCLLPE
ncbi:hypothetical protein ABZP36_008306 [Zizania latifolia]